MHCLFIPVPVCENVLHWLSLAVQHWMEMIDEVLSSKIPTPNYALPRVDGRPRAMSRIPMI